MESKISALMCVRNEATYIKTSIMSIIDFVDEIVVFDNHSTDDTVDVITNQLINSSEIIYKNKIRLISSPVQLYIDDAYNAAKKEIKTEWMIKWDGDYIAYSTIKTLLDVRMSNKCDCVAYYVLDLIGDFHHVNIHSKYKQHNIFLCKTNHVSFSSNDKYALTYCWNCNTSTSPVTSTITPPLTITPPHTRIHYMNDPEKYPCFAVHVGKVKSTKEILCKMYKNEYDVYVKKNNIDPTVYPIDTFFKNVLKKDMHGSVRWLTKAFNQYATPHDVLLPKYLLDRGTNNTEYFLENTNGMLKHVEKHNGNKVNNYKITLIIRVDHNHDEKFLQACVDSIIDQDFTAWNLIIINDQKEELSLLTSFLVDRNNIRLIQNRRYLGPIKSYKTAIMQTETDVVGFVDDPNVLSKRSALSDIMKIYNTHENFNIFVCAKSESNMFITFKPIHYYMSEGLNEDFVFGDYFVDVLSSIDEYADLVYVDTIITIAPNCSRYNQRIKDNKNEPIKNNQNGPIKNNQNGPIKNKVNAQILAKHNKRHNSYFPRYMESIGLSSILIEQPNEKLIISVNDYFDHVYLINLKRDHVKRERMINIFNKLKIECEVFPAVLGMDHYDDYVAKCNKKNYVPGAYGYTLSMHNILTDAKTRGFKNILVFDDDVIFHKDFINKFDEFVRVIPHAYDWYILSLGVSGPWAHPFTNTDYAEYDHTKLYTNSFFNTAGSHAIGYSHELFDEIIKITSTFENAYDDEILQYYTQNHLSRCYAAMPHLVLSDASRSDISKKCDKIIDNYQEYHFKYRINLGQYDMDSLHHKRYNLLKKTYRPLVSIIMTVYDKEEWLEDTINSVLNQTYKNLELVLVEDRSPDNCKEILKKYKSNPRVKILYNEENVGCYVSRNRALKVCEGEFIGFHDADDYCVSTRIEKQIKLMTDKGLKMTATDMLRSHLPNFKGMSEDQIISEANRCRTHYIYSESKTDKTFAPCCRSIFNYPTMIFDREIFDKFGNFIEYRKGMDMEYNERMLFKYEGKVFDNDEDSWEFFENNNTFYYEKIPEMLVISSEMTEKNITNKPEYVAEFERRKKEWRQNYLSQLKK